MCSLLTRLRLKIVLSERLKYKESENAEKTKRQPSDSEQQSEGQADSETVPGGSDLHHQQVSSAAAPSATTVTVATTKPRGKRRAGAGVTRDNGATMNGGTNATDHHNNNNNNPPVKTERLSPSATSSATASTTTTTVSGAGNAASNTPDNNSSSSRSATPSSSYPGTPPGGLPTERGTSPSSSPAGHIKHMEQMMTRNYSDFMRSLAAKYNNANPNDYFSSPSRNGFPVGLDPRFTPFKTGATPFVGLMAPLATTMPSPGQNKNNITLTNSTTTTSTSSTNPIVGTTASSKDSLLDTNHLKKPSSSSSVEAQQALYAAAANFGANPFGTAAASNTSMFPPLIDMSSTQALLSMVRTASAHNASQLETYLKGAIKRPPPSESSPLDLSSASLPAYGKRSRTNKGLGGASENIFLNSDSLLHVPMVDALRTTKERLGKRTGSVSPKPPVRNSGGSSAGSSPRLLPTSTVTSAGQQHLLGRTLPCLSLCSTDRGCSSGGEAQAMSHWSVDDVCSFVSTIDICAEYASNFREQRIDGSSLPLLTEEHLTTTMGMKLGPALKLRATLSRRLGHCAVCMHCVHCHNAPGSLVSPAQTPPSVVGRPNSTGN